jgi:hypothetical protein
MATAVVRLCTSSPTNVVGSMPPVSLCLRPGAGHSGATLDPGIPETGPFSSGGEHNV